MKKSKMNKLLNEIEKEGLLIKGFHNGIPSDIATTTKHAEKFLDEYLDMQKYILMSVPHSLELIESLDYNIVFTAIESVAFKMDIDMQRKIHKYAFQILVSDGDVDAKYFIKEVKKWNIPRHIKTELFSEIDDWKISIINELKNIIKTLNTFKNEILEREKIYGN
ncbi:hypothetical protein INTERNEXUS_177 [Bacillus phage vB_BspM_Internexus]|nr:hypothetical protein INTERNEXUS_177 [Bacillus phage vB_BspM_Internexus]